MDIKNICENWFKNPLINPKTNRKIIKDSPKYKEFKKICNKIDINEEIDKNDNDRIKIFKLINSILTSINNKNSNNTCVKCSSINQCYIGDFIKIDEILSSGTLSGVIYKSNINNNNISIKIVNDYETISKKTINNDINCEIRTLEFLTKYVIKTGFPHFPITYDVLKCERKLLNKYDNIPDDIVKLYKKNTRGNILMIISELADGSLYNFYMNELKQDYKSDINKKILLNTFGQIFISLIFFHKIVNAYHNDSHTGNFLFRKIAPGGYYHYKIFNKDYYIENLGYVWEIWDFGLTIAFSNSEEINNNRIDIIEKKLFSYKYKKPRKLIKYFSINTQNRNVIFDYYYNISHYNRMISMFPNNNDSKYLYDFFNEFKSYNFINKNSSLNPLNVSVVDDYVLSLMLKYNLIKDKINTSDIIINKEPYLI